jgi:hypothetical protein
MTYWLENGMVEAHAKHTLVDMGDVNKQAARDATDRLMEHTGRRNVQVVGAGRITVRLPPRKRANILRKFPQIAEGAAGYCWCTHGWVGVGEG